MLNKLFLFIRKYDLIAPGDPVICALSGGADSVTLLFALYLLKEKLGIHLEAAHFNHHLRAEESDRDEAFARELCSRYEIPLHIGSAQVAAGKKGLEAAAREARYAYFATLSGKIATAHTADDNAETVLLHMVRGTGLKGLGGIMPRNGNVIRPMLTVTRSDVEFFLNEWSLTHIHDSSNDTDAFLRNRLRHHLMPRLKEENPKIAENLSAMALRLRQDEECLAEMSLAAGNSVEKMRLLHPALRARALERLLKEYGVREPESDHIALAEALVFSDNPSASARFPGGVTVTRCYDRLEKLVCAPQIPETVLQCPGVTELPEQRLRVICEAAQSCIQLPDTFTVRPEGDLVIRSRLSGDTIRMSCGTKSVKKLFIDRKIPASQRPGVPIIADDAGVIGIYGFGVNCDREASALPAVTVRLEKYI